MKGVYIPHCPTNGIMLGYKQDLFLLNPSFSDHLRHISRIGDMFIPYLDALKYQIINNMIHIFHQYSPLWQCCFGYVYISDRRWHIISIYISYIYIFKLYILFRWCIIYLFTLFIYWLPQQPLVQLVDFAAAFARSTRLRLQKRFSHARVVWGATAAAFESMTFSQIWINDDVGKTWYNNNTING